MSGNFCRRGSGSSEAPLTMCGGLLKFLPLEMPKSVGFQHGMQFSHFLKTGFSGPEVLDFRIFHAGFAPRHQRCAWQSFLGLADCCDPIQEQLRQENLRKKETVHLLYRRLAPFAFVL